jgi:hypothetical protein
MFAAVGDAKLLQGKESLRASVTSTEADHKNH